MSPQSFTSRLASSGRISLLAVPALALSLFCAPALDAQLLSYDGFGNGPLANLAGSTGGTGWTSAWQNTGSNVTKVAAPGLSWPGMALSPGAAVTPTAGGAWPNSYYQRSFGSLPAGTNAIYVSFLMRDDAAWGSWCGLQFGTYPYAMTVGSPLGYYSYGMMLSEGLGDFSNKPLVMGETTLVVVKISKTTPTAGITYRMYLDPAIGSSEPGFPAAQFAVGPVNALPTSLTLTNATGFTTDEIRVGLDWASVLPDESTWTDLGLGKLGVRGVPVLQGSGSLGSGSANQLGLTKGARAAPATLVIGLTQLAASFKGGTLVPMPDVLVAFTTDAAGALNVPFVFPTGVPTGAQLFFQFWIQDAVATFGLSASNGLRGETP